MRLNELLGIEFPFIQGGMANIATAEFAAAVSNAGALGLIGAGGMSPEVFQDSIRRCRTLTEKPFGVNIMLMHPQVEQLAAIAAQEKVAVVTTGAGDPARFIPAWKESGAKVFPVIPAVALAKVVARAGADAVIAEGTESGGHVGELTTMALVPQVADAVDIPVIAAGGIADGRQLLAAREVHREFKFSILMPAADYGPGLEGEEVLLQGVVDCWFDGLEGITVLDFKSDRIRPGGEAARGEEYRPQLEAYSRALEKVLEKPVVRRVLYFLAPGREVELPPKASE